MTNNDRDVEAGSEADLAIQRALDAANLRAGDSLGTSTAFVAREPEPSAAEVGDIGAGFDGD